MKSVRGNGRRVGYATAAVFALYTGGCGSPEPRGDLFRDETPLLQAQVEALKKYLGELDAERARQLGEVKTGREALVAERTRIGTDYDAAVGDLNRQRDDSLAAVGTREGELNTREQEIERTYTGRRREAYGKQLDLVRRLKALLPTEGEALTPERMEAAGQELDRVYKQLFPEPPPVPAEGAGASEGDKTPKEGPAPGSGTTPDDLDE